MRKLAVAIVVVFALGMFILAVAPSADAVVDGLPHGESNCIPDAWRYTGDLSGDDIVLSVDTSCKYTAVKV